MIKQFKDIENGQVFQINQAEYKKIEPVKISCCRSLNAESTTNANDRIFIQPLSEVEVND